MSYEFRKNRNSIPSSFLDSTSIRRGNRNAYTSDRRSLLIRAIKDHFMSIPKHRIISYSISNWNPSVYSMPQSIRILVGPKTDKLSKSSNQLYSSFRIINIPSLLSYHIIECLIVILLMIFPRIEKVLKNRLSRRISDSPSKPTLIKDFRTSSYERPLRRYKLLN